MPLWMSKGTDLCRGCGELLALVTPQELSTDEKARRYDRLEAALREHMSDGNKFAFQFWLLIREPAIREEQMRVNWVAHDFLQGFTVGVAWVQMRLDGFQRKIK